MLGGYFILPHPVVGRLKLAQR